MFPLGEVTTYESQYPVAIEAEGVVQGQRLTWARELLSPGGNTTYGKAKELIDIAKNTAKDVKDAAAGQNVVLPVLAYYGTSRLWRPKKEKFKDLQKSRLLGYLDAFSPDSSEKMLMEWLKLRALQQIQEDRQLSVLQAVLNAVTGGTGAQYDLYWKVAEDRAVVRHKESGREMPFYQMSDGIRTMIGVVADIAYRAAVLNSQLGERIIQETPGIVLIDEIDLHLHPTWQQRVIRDLRLTFPKIQFILTSHSPFIIQSLWREDNLIDLDPKSTGEHIDKSIEEIAQDVQGVPNVRRSLRYQEMVQNATHYFELLDSSKKADAHRIGEIRQELDQITEQFEFEPAYTAFLDMQRQKSGIDKARDAKS
jgi:predicted ATP-binding protein involved in virulence